MRVLVTGASGYIGSAIARALHAHDHHVVGLARSQASANLLAGASVEAVCGSLEEPDQLRRAVDSVDAVVHAAFARHGVDNLAEAAATETSGVRAILSVLGNRPFVYTSGIGVVGDTGDRIVTEDDPVDPPPAMAWRRALELDTLQAENGIVIRPSLVYGRAGSLVLTGLVRAAIGAGAARYAAPGDNTRPHVHVDDLGEVFALALQNAPAGSVLNIVSGHSTAREVTEAIGRLIGKPEATAGLPIEQARNLVPFVDWMGSSQHIDGNRARSLLGWKPSGPTLVEDIEFGSYRTSFPSAQRADLPSSLPRAPLP